MLMKFKNNLKALRTARRITQPELAQALKDAGISNPTKQRIAKIEKGDQQMTAEEIQVYAAALACTPDEILGKEAAQPLRNKSEKISQLPQRNHSIPSSIPRSKTPVYGPAAAGSPERILLTDEFIVEEIDTPPELISVRSGFVMYVAGDSMRPRYKHGEMVSVHPNRRPNLEQDCVAVMDEDGNVIVKEFVGETETEWKFKQYNPEKIIKVKKSDVRAIYAIVGRPS